MTDNQDNPSDEQLYEHHAFRVVKGQQPLRIDKYLMNFIENATRNKIQAAAKGGSIFVNDIPVKSNYKVRPNDVITVKFEHPPHENLLIAEDIPIDVVYEDDDLLVVNKPAGMVALVWGNMNEDEGTIEGNIGRHPKNRLQNTVYLDDEAEKGKPAVTHYKVIERLGYVTLVSCKLETGRTHQIRVHMKHIGHTLFNDARYGGERILKGTTFTKYKQFVDNCFKILPRQALHAKTLGFVHPTTGEFLKFESEVPQDIAECIEKWRHYAKHQDN